MKTVFLGLAALCLAGCAMEPPYVSSEKLPVFGDPLPGTIHVVARRGFKRPGNYYLPKGATLGLLIDVAGWKPVNDARGFVVRGRIAWKNDISFLRVIHARERDGRKDSYNSWLDEKGIPSLHRDRPLLDGDLVQLSGFCL